MRYIQHDPRFRILNKVSEKKQLFNAWKVQRQKEERVCIFFFFLVLNFKDFFWLLTFADFYLMLYSAFIN